MFTFLQLKDRCRSGLSGSPGKRVLGKTNRGFESLPVRPYYVQHSRDFEGLGGQGYLLTQRAPRPGRGMKGFGIQGGPIPPCAVTAKANLPRRWVFRLIAEARINNAVALQRQPYLGVECFD